MGNVKRKTPGYECKLCHTAVFKKCECGGEAVKCKDGKWSFDSHISKQFDATKPLEE